MNKRNLAVINILFIAVYLLSASMIFSLVETVLANKYRTFQNNIVQEVHDIHNLSLNGKSQLTSNQLLGRFSEYYNYKDYPFVLALFNENNEIVAQTGSYIQIGNYTDSKDEYIFIDKYLTSESKQQIKEFLKSVKYPTSIKIKELNYIEKDNTKIPISLVLIDENNEDNETYINLSSSKYNNEIQKLDSSSAYMDVQFVNIFEKKHIHNYYKRINEMLTEIDVSKNFASKGGGGISGEETIYDIYLEIADGDYSMVLLAIYDDELETLLSNDFIYFLIYLAVLFIVFYLIASVLIKKYIKKKNKLEEAKTAFTSAAAHELKTPLAVIENQCECIMENIAPEKNTEYINSIYSEALRMNKLIASLLQYNRLLSANNIKMERYRLDEIVNTEIQKYQSFFSTKNINLETVISENAEAKCNAELIALVIDNYLSNAIKHTESGRTIRISLIKRNNFYEFSAYNEGKNIPEENKHMLFNALYKTDKSRNRDDNSTGMGLAICKEILEQHKFTYGFNNKKDGVEFYFTT